MDNDWLEMLDFVQIPMLIFIGLLVTVGFVLRCKDRKHSLSNMPPGNN